MTDVAEVSRQSLQEATLQEATLSSTFQDPLAPPFGTGWSTYRGPSPKGFWTALRLYSANGHAVLQLGAEAHPPGAPLTIGWFWAGWRQRVSVQLATAFTARVACERVVVKGGGVWVPRATITLRRVGSAEYYENSARLYPGQSVHLAVVAPQSDRLPATVDYDLSVGFSVRSAFQGSATPVGEVAATIQEVMRQFAFPLGAEGTEALAGEGLALRSGDGKGDGEIDRAELARALAALDEQAVVREVGSDRDALTGGPVSLEE